MIDLYFAPTPNGWKAAIMLEETGLDYRPILMRLAEGDQFAPEFLAISPNAKMPAIVDHAPAPEWGEDPVPVFEVGRDPAVSRRQDRPLRAAAGRPARAQGAD